MAYLEGMSAITLLVTATLETDQYLVSVLRQNDKKNIFYVLFILISLAMLTQMILCALSSGVTLHCCFSKSEDVAILFCLSSSL